jgi:hypothetical protein
MTLRRAGRNKSFSLDWLLKCDGKADSFSIPQNFYLTRAQQIIKPGAKKLNISATRLSQ